MKSYKKNLKSKSRTKKHLTRKHKSKVLQKGGFPSTIKIGSVIESTGRKPSKLYTITDIEISLTETENPYALTDFEIDTNSLSQDKIIITKDNGDRINLLELVTRINNKQYILNPEEQKLTIGDVTYTIGQTFQSIISGKTYKIKEFRFNQNTSNYGYGMSDKYVNIIVYSEKGKTYPLFIIDEIFKGRIDRGEYILLNNEESSNEESSNLPTLPPPLPPPRVTSVR
jgi:hypothetical protein